MKLRYTMWEDLQKLTRREMDFVLWLARRQDDEGNIYGVHYKDVALATGMPKATFYAIKDSLESKGVIRSSAGYQDFNIVLLHNAATDPEHPEKGGYINLNREIFHRKQFKRLRAKERFLLFDLIRKCGDKHRGWFHKRRLSLLAEYAKLLGVTRAYIQRAVKWMRLFFAITLQNGIYVIKWRSKLNKKRESYWGGGKYPLPKAEIDCQLEQTIGAILRHEKANATENDVRELTVIYKQYQGEAKKQKRSIKDLLSQSIAGSFAEVKRGVTRVIQPKYVHKLLRDEINRYYSLGKESIGQDEKMSQNANGRVKKINPSANATSRFNNFETHYYDDIKEMEKELVNARLFV